LFKQKCKNHASITYFARILQGVLWVSMLYSHVYVNSLPMYRVSMKSFPNYKHLLQENYVEYKHFFFPKGN